MIIKQNKKGQTLVEVMVVTFIIGILAAAAISVMKGQSHKSIKIWDYAAITNITTVIDEINLAYQQKRLLGFSEGAANKSKEWGGGAAFIASDANTHIEVLKEFVNVLEDNASSSDSNAITLSTAAKLKNGVTMNVSTSGKSITLPNGQIWYFGTPMFWVTGLTDSEATWTETGKLISAATINSAIGQGATGYKVLPVFIDVDGSARGDNTVATSTNGGDIAPYLLFIDYKTPAEDTDNRGLQRTSFILPYGSYADSDRLQVRISRSDGANITSTTTTTTSSSDTGSGSGSGSTESSSSDTYGKAIIRNYRSAVCQSGHIPSYENLKLDDKIKDSFCGSSTETTELAEEDGFTYLLEFIPPVKGLKNIRGVNIN